MEAGGNEKLNSFLSQYGVPKETDIVPKYNTNAASVYRDRIQALAEGKPWRDPPVVKETIGGSNKKPPLASGGGGGGNYRRNGGWDSWDNDDSVRSNSNNDIRRNQSVSDFRGNGDGGNGGVPVRSRSSADMYTRSQLEASAANKETFFASKMAENESRPDGVPPSQGGKYVGFGSSPAPSSQGNNNNYGNSQGDVLAVVSQGFGRLSLAAQSAASVVQASTKDITSKVKEGGYDYKVNETVNVVAAKTTEIGQRTWGIMKGVMAIASQKVEEYAKEGGWKAENWQRNENESNGYYQDFNKPENKGWNSSNSGGQSSSTGHINSNSSNSWDDWDQKDTRKQDNIKSSGSHNNDSWAGWDDAKDDGYDDHFYQSAPDNKSVGHNGKSDGTWTGGGFL